MLTPSPCATPPEAAGPPGPPRRGTGPGEEGLREMNKKLQNMLEEQLTKNLHLGQVGGASGKGGGASGERGGV